MAETVSAQVTDAMEDIVRAGQEQAVRQMEQSLMQSRRYLDQTSDLSTRSFDDLAALGRRSVESLLTVNIGTTSALAMFWREIGTFSRIALDRGIATGARLAEARSLQDVVGIQADYVKACVDDLVKFSELAAQAAVPLNQNVQSDTTRRFKPKAA